MQRPWQPDDHLALERLQRIRRRGRIALFDPGSSKLAWGIATWGAESPEQGSERIAIRAADSVASRGYRGEVVTDMRELEASVRELVDSVESRAGSGRVDDVMVAVGGRDVKSCFIRGDARVAGREVTDRDMLRAMRNCGVPDLPDGHLLLHALPVHYAVDDRDGIFDPRRMVGRRVTVDMVWITVRESSVRELESCLANCGLRVAGFIAKPYAAGLGCPPAPDGVAACIDLGAATTGVSVFARGRCIYTAVLPWGGRQITEVIARHKGVDLAEAERRKCNAGDAPCTESMEIASADLRKLFKEALACVDDAEFSGAQGRKAWLCGGGSQFQRVLEAARTMGCPVEVAKPSGVWWPSEQAGKPEYTTLAGLARHAREGLREMWDYDLALSGGVISVFQRTIRWMRDSW